MASDEIRVNPNALRKNATAFDRSADTANGIAGRLRDGVHRLDPKNYGDDDTGEAFQKEYVKSRDQLVQGIDGIVAMIRAVAEGVRMTADAYQQADDVVRGVGP